MWLKLKSNVTDRGPHFDGACHIGGEVSRWSLGLTVITHREQAKTTEKSSGHSLRVYQMHRRELCTADIQSFSEHLIFKHGRALRR